MNKIKFILTVSLSLLIALSAQAQSKKEIRAAKEAATAAKVDSLITARDLVIEINRISPMSGRSFSSIDGYKLSIIKDSISTYLPYFGKITSPSFVTANDISIDIDEAPVEIEVKAKDDRTTLSFSCHTKTSHERCQFYIEIMDNGSSTIRLDLTSRDPISYYGQLRDIDD